MPEERSAIYIDGSNFYHSSRKYFDQKVDIEKFCNELTEDSYLVKINYYDAPLDQTEEPEKYKGQQRFFSVLRDIPDLNLILGRLENREADGVEYKVEKGTDVNIAIDLVMDAKNNVYDKAYLVSNDGDFSPAVKSAKDLGGKVIYVCVGNLSYHLDNVCNSTFQVNEEFISDVAL